jgi:hypothetical protein
MKTVYITEEFKSVLSQITNGYSQDYIKVYRVEGDKVFFEYGRSKLHITNAELEEYTQRAS